MHPSFSNFGAPESLVITHIAELQPQSIWVPGPGVKPRTGVLTLSQVTLLPHLQGPHQKTDVMDPEELCHDVAANQGFTW